MNSRSPAVAGQFYASDRAALARDVGALLGTAELGTAAVPKAMIVPHAGYVYSGPVAASAYRLLEPVRQSIRRVVLLGPAHRVAFDGLALPSTDAFATPLGDVPIDQSAVEAIRELPGVVVSDAAHAAEHALEVQLPFLQTLLDDFSIVPIVVGHADPDAVGRVIDALWGGPETLIVVSSDLSHYHSYREARDIDTQTNRRIQEKAAGLSGDEACGAHAINGLMRSRNVRELNVETVDLRNSGDTAGDKGRVVGYGAFILH